MIRTNISENEAQEQIKMNSGKAKELLDNRDKLDEFLLKLERKLKVVPKLGETLAIIPTMISLVRSYSKKEYTEIPLGTIISIIGALIYFLSPIDIIPDSIPGVGHFDDASVILACLKWVGDDIKKYEEWRDNR